MSKTPKPLPNGATRFLIDNCMDFFNLDFEKLSHELVFDNCDLLAVANVILPTVANPLSVISGATLDQTIRSMKGCGWEEKFPLQHLLCTLAGVRAMIHTALGGGGHVNFPANYYEKHGSFERPTNNIDLISWLEDAMKGLYSWPAWHSAGHTRIELLPYNRRDFTSDSKKLMSERDRFNTWLKGFRGYMVKMIGESFDAWSGETPNGAFFIGNCPKCFKIFEKKTQRQIFCSPSCQEALKQDRYRKKKKITDTLVFQ